MKAKPEALSARGWYRTFGKWHPIYIAIKAHPPKDRASIIGYLRALVNRISEESYWAAHMLRFDFLGAIERLSTPLLIAGLETSLLLWETPPEPKPDKNSWRSGRERDLANRRDEIEGFLKTLFCMSPGDPISTAKAIRQAQRFVSRGERIDAYLGAIWPAITAAKSKSEIAQNLEVIGKAFDAGSTTRAILPIGAQLSVHVSGISFCNTLERIQELACSVQNDVLVVGMLTAVMPIMLAVDASAGAFSSNLKIVAACSRELARTGDNEGLWMYQKSFAVLYGTHASQLGLPRCDAVELPRVENASRGHRLYSEIWEITKLIKALRSSRELDWSKFTSDDAEPLISEAMEYRARNQRYRIEVTREAGYFGPSNSRMISYDGGRSYVPERVYFRQASQRVRLIPVEEYASQ